MEEGENVPVIVMGNQWDLMLTCGGLCVWVIIVCRKNNTYAQRLLFMPPKTFQEALGNIFFLNIAFPLYILLTHNR